MDSDIILEKQDLTHLQWTKPDGVGGSFLKVYENGIYYKLSCVGHESVNELIVDRLLTILGVPHLSYKLIHADIVVDGKAITTYVCASKDFKKPGEDKIALELYYEQERREGESPLEFCVRKGWGNYVYSMLVVDFLILNRDRHGANIEVLRDPSRRKVRLAPLFDHGLSLLFSGKFDVMEDRRVQSFVGTGSALKNLSLIPKQEMPTLKNLHLEDRDNIMDKLDGVIPSLLQDKIWEMIWKRWCYFESFRNM